MSVKKEGKLLVLTSTTINEGGKNESREEWERLLNCVYRDVL
jgi:hypothetical protein